ncbi:nuclear receptor subfamily 0 group B member 1 [Callorhinchus milii]|uniref:Nuclear receptor subfamily 0 group B member 2-like n=1 Tax=Callorhinchus milii TaxID=7868 RepID=A0A4W3ICV2_CALMI|nr:nuclear receptor subfamily 0 group B member 1 [Callorhinchus milii]|eukprot:gi/632973619/ref/XP_007903240.1/ PREDICTED: nuclear receptor subfamily 0 group B member 2-like [Callorhinchus milii]
MACVSQSVSFHKCHCGQRPHTGILYSILNQDHQGESNRCHSLHYQPISALGCSCEVRRKVVLRTPERTCRLSSEVLLKTLNFIKNLPSFCQLPEGDQVLLVQNSWAPLFVLGLAQEGVDFEVTEANVPSLLRRILLNQKVVDGQIQETAMNAPSLAEVQRVKMFLAKFWSMDISTKEYAYLKGITLFNPDVPSLSTPRYILGLQQEAQHTLNEFIGMMHNGDHARFAQILLALSTLRMVSVTSVTELFFRPVLGKVNMNELLFEMLYAKLN